MQSGNPAQDARRCLEKLQDALEDLDALNVGSARRKALLVSFKLRELIANLERQL